MVRIRLPYLWEARAKGRKYYYYRRDGQRIPVTSERGRRLAPKDAGFAAAYDAIHATFEDAGRPPAAPGTLDALIIEYRKSSMFKQLSPRSRKDYGVYLDLLREDYGDLMVRTMPRPFVFRLREKYAETPRKANYLISILRRVMQFAVNQGYRTDNPAAKPERLKEGPGHRPWEEYEVAAFRKTYPEPVFERAAFELLLNTGQRSGDVASMQRSHRYQGHISVAQSKTGERLTIPEAQDLTEILSPYISAHDGLMLLVTKSGGPVKTAYLQHKMIAAYKAAGLSGVTTHGLRYTAATRLRELGCDWEIVAAVTGHRTADMARKYMRQRRMAQIAITRLDDARNTSATPGNASATASEKQSEKPE